MFGTSSTDGPRSSRRPNRGPALLRIGEARHAARMRPGAANRRSARAGPNPIQGSWDCGSGSAAIWWGAKVQVQSVDAMSAVPTSVVKSNANRSISPTSIGSNGVANRIDASSSTGSSGFVAPGAAGTAPLCAARRKQLSQTEPFTAVDQVQPRRRRSLVSSVSLDRDVGARPRFTAV